MYINNIKAVKCRAFLISMRMWIHTVQ